MNWREMRVISHSMNSLSLLAFFVWVFRALSCFRLSSIKRTYLSWFSSYVNWVMMSLVKEKNCCLLFSIWCRSSLRSSSNVSDLWSSVSWFSFALFVSSLDASCAFLEPWDFLMNDYLSIDESSFAEHLSLRIIVISIIDILRNKNMPCWISARSSECQQCNVSRR